MATLIEGRVVKGLGGLYEIRTDSGDVYSSRAKGVLKRDENRVVVGDRVTLRVGDAGGDLVIAEILPRKNSLIRPLMANLDLAVVLAAACQPTPIPLTVDKMTAILTHNGIKTAVCVTKADLAPEAAEAFADIYRKAGFPTFVVSTVTGEGFDVFRDFMEKSLDGGRTAAFAGASGIGKSTLMNALFPTLCLQTGDVSERIGRGKHTTRAVELFPAFGGFLADTPGFSMLDFTRFDFMTLDELPLAFPEFADRLGHCRYTDCTHTKEEDCAVVKAVRRGDISESRHKSFLSVYEDLKSKNPYS